MRWLAAAVLLLVSCDPKPQPPAFSDANAYPGSTATPTNPYSRQIFEMGGQLRRATFRKLMVNSSKPCDLVTEGILRGNDQETDFWRVTCTDSGQWMVSIAPDSSTKLTHCLTLAKLGDDCSEPLK